MKNTILTNLASINATIVGIIFAVLVAFFIYSYQTVTQVKEQLNDLRKTTAKIMHSPTVYWAGNIKYSDYVTEDKTLDYDRIRKEFLDINLTKMTVFGEVWRFPNKPDMATQDEIKDRATHLFDLITMLSVSPPYSEKFNIDKKSLSISPHIETLEYNSKWQKDLINLNGFLVMIWNRNKDGIMKIFLDYKKLNSEKKTPEPFDHPADFEKIVLSFFDRVYLIQANVVPQVKDLSYKLNLFQEKFEVKKYVVLTLVFAIFILVVGVFLPLFVHLYFKTPHKRKMEVALLCATMLQYLIIIIIFLTKALSMEFK